MSQVFCQTLLKPLPGFSFEGAATQALSEEQQMMATLKALKVERQEGGQGVGSSRNGAGVAPCQLGLRRV